MPPTPAPVRASALDRDRVRPSTSVPGAVTDGPESSAAPVPFAAMPVVAPAALPLTSTPGVASAGVTPAPHLTYRHTAHPSLVHMRDAHGSSRHSTRSTGGDPSSAE